MATEDRTRSAFYPGKRYAGVRMQQGRVLTDDDYNEGAHIAQEDTRATRVDVIGPHGSPDEGFLISDAGPADDGQVDFLIHAGTYYVGGLRATLEPDAGQRFREQTDWLQNPGVAAPSAESSRNDFVYLEVWQQPVSAVEDAELFEAALGGPDTATRMRTMARVRVYQGVDATTCAAAAAETVAEWVVQGRGSWNVRNYELRSDATLTVSFSQDEGDEDLCSPQRTGGYLGAENQAIRVQLVGDGDAFTWGFDNGAPLYRVQVVPSDDDSTTLRLLTAPKDHHHWPIAGQVVQLLPWGVVLPNGEKLAEELAEELDPPGFFAKVTGDYDPDTRELTIDAAPLPDEFGLWESRSDAESLRALHAGTEDGTVFLFLRVWDRGSDLESDAEIEIPDGSSAVPLGHTGLRIQVGGDTRRAGDYWIIAARPETPNEVVPWELQAGRLPDGIRRFYAPLALIQWQGRQVVRITDCRKTFRPLTDLETCCRYTVGDGTTSHGDFDSLGKAVENLPPAGGEICLLPGIHRANLAVPQAFNIQIKGCGLQTWLLPVDPTRPVLQFSDCALISVSECTILNLGQLGNGSTLAGGTAVQMTRCAQVRICDNVLVAYEHAIDIEQSVAVTIRGNSILMWNRPGGDVGIVAGGSGLAIEQNHLSLFRAADLTPSEAEGSSSAPGGDICDDPEELASYLASRSAELPATLSPTAGMTSRGLVLRPWIYSTVSANPALGGIQILSGSRGVKLIENRIVGGAGHGITLGSDVRLNALQEQGNAEQFRVLNPIFNLTIEDNTLSQMGLSGIGTPYRSLTEAIDALRSDNGDKPNPLLARLALNWGIIAPPVIDCAIRGNRITDCLLEQHPEIVQRRGEGGISLGLCENLSLRDNWIEGNGPDYHYPVCGIFVAIAFQADISENRILDNGRLAGEISSPSPGYRGGLVIRSAASLTFLGPLLSIVSGIGPVEVLSDDTTELMRQLAFISESMGNYAARVHNNQIKQPVGQAIHINAWGPVAVTHNTISTDFAADPWAGVVSIVNVGRPPAWRSKLSDKHKTKPEELLAPSGNMLFDHNQTRLAVATGCVSSQLIATLDDLGFAHNQSDVLLRGDDLKINTLLLGATVRASGNRFKEAF